MKKFPLHALLFSTALACSTLHAIDIVGAGASGPNQVNLNGTYTQNFDGLLSSTPVGGVPWQNNLTIPGWYSTQTSYIANSYLGGLSSYGTDGDRALGSIAAVWAVRFVNNTDQNISGFTVSFDAEQWYRGANNPQVINNLFLYYRIYDSNISEVVEAELQPGTEWILINEAIFSSPNATLTSGAPLDGNLAENRGFVSVTVDNIALAPGEKLWFQWGNGNDPGNDHGLATDNVAVSFITAPIPEPATFAAFLGLGALVLVQARRRRAE